MKAVVLIIFAVIGMAGLAAPLFKLTASSFWVDEFDTVYQLHPESSI